MCLPTESLELPGKSNQFENWCFLYLIETKSCWCGEVEGEEEKGEEEGKKSQSEDPWFHLRGPWVKTSPHSILEGAMGKKYSF